MRPGKKDVGSWRDLMRRRDLLRPAHPVEKRFVVALSGPVTNSLLLLLGLGLGRLVLVFAKHLSSIARFLGSLLSHLLHPHPSEIGRVFEVG